MKCLNIHFYLKANLPELHSPALFTIKKGQAEKRNKENFYSFIFLIESVIYDRKIYMKVN